MLPSPARAVYGGNPPFAGGDRAVARTPVSVGGRIGDAAPRRAPPVVDPGPVLRARNTSGTNVRIPYARLTPTPRAEQDGDNRGYYKSRKSLVANDIAWIANEDGGRKRRRDTDNPLNGAVQMMTTGEAEVMVRNKHKQVLADTIQGLVKNLPTEADASIESLFQPGSSMKEWPCVPDGVVISASHGGSGFIEGIGETDLHMVTDQHLLVNVGVQGPTVTRPPQDQTDALHNPKPTSTLDTFYVVEIADVLLEASGLDANLNTHLGNDQNKSFWENKEKPRDWNIDAFKGEVVGTAAAARIIPVNLDNNPGDARVRLVGASSSNMRVDKLGLFCKKLSTGSWVARLPIAAWRIGRVMDTAAARSGLGNQSTGPTPASASRMLVNVAIRELAVRS